MSEISVIIPFYNSGEYIDECVDSVLKQTFQDFNIIIVDDGSDRINSFSAKIQLKKDSRIRLITLDKNYGPSYARNIGIKNSKSKFILPLDSDNYLLDYSLQIYYDTINNSENKFVYGWIKKIGFENKIWEVPEYNIENLFYNENTIDTCAMYKRSDWDLVGGYDENIKYAEDWDFWLNFAVHGITGILVKEVLFVYRHRKNSLLYNLRGKDLERYKKRISIRNKYPQLDINKNRIKK